MPQFHPTQSIAVVLSDSMPQLFFRRRFRFYFEISMLRALRSTNRRSEITSSVRDIFYDRQL